MSARAEPRRSSIPPAIRRSQLVYLYGIVEPGTDAHQRLQGRQILGLEPGEPLFPVESAGLVAAASYVPAAVFQEQPLNDLITDLPRLSPYAVRHDAAIAALGQAESALIPMGFGAVYRDAERVAAVLRDRAEEFRALLDRVRGRQEWGIKAAADRDRLLQWVLSTSAEVGRLDADLATATPGRAYLLRKQRERVLQGELNRVLGVALGEVVAELSRPSVAARQDELPTQRPVEGTQLVLKAAFLVDRERADEFRDLADALAQRLGPSGLTLDLTGPWAPYSFVSETAR